MKVYLASRYSRREELCTYADEIRALGHEITSRWLLGLHNLTPEGLSTEGTEEQRQRFAMEDWADLMAAQLCVSFTEPPRSTNNRGGRHVEYGAALATGVACVVVGPAENVFHCLPGIRRFDTWSDAHSAISRMHGFRDLVGNARLYRRHYCAVCHEPLNHLYVFDGNDGSVLCPEHVGKIA